MAGLKKGRRIPFAHGDQIVRLLEHDPPGVAFTYAPGRSGQYADDILKEFNGILQVAVYAGYNRLLKRADQGVELAYCWAHERYRGRSQTEPDHRSPAVEPR